MQSAEQGLVRFDNSYARLPERFYVRLPPEPVASPRLVAFNRPLAEALGLDWRALEPVAADVFSGNVLPPGAEPIAMAYAGHQFGHFVPQLGDGRAILLGEVVDRDGQRRDIQLKGSGRTPFSRRGDGRAALGPVLREYLVSEAMHALGVPTTRSLAAVTTGEPVYRDDVLPGAVLTRIAAGHVRVGTFQYLAARGDEDAVRRLADYVIARHDPDLAAADQPYVALLDRVAARQAALIARWLHLGFVHGVMNTDNTAVSGETIDYGPCAFVDAYDPGAVFSSIDHGGRYAFANQPAIALWNLARLAECLLPLLDPDPERALDAADGVLSAFGPRFERAWLDGMRGKLGLATAEADDRALADGLLAAMHAGGADFTLTFRRLCDAAEAGGERGAGEGADGGAAGSVQAGIAAGAEESVRRLFADPALWDRWAADWRLRLARDPQPPALRAAAMRGVSPAIIPRNHRVEEALAAAIEGDLRPFESLHAALTHPYDPAPEHRRYEQPPPPSDRPYRTFCGT